MQNPVVMHFEDALKRYPGVLYVDTAYGRIEADMEPLDAERVAFMQWADTIAKYLATSGVDFKKVKLAYADFKAVSC